MEQKSLKELDGIDNVRQWMRAYVPTEWQTPCIPRSLTFTWLMNHIHEQEKWWAKLDLDTAPRNLIVNEAIRRLLVRISKSGLFRRAFEKMLKEMTDWD